MALEIRDANRFGPLTEDRLEMLEAELNGHLPDDYRAFLLQHNGGRPTLSQFTFEVDGKVEESVVEWFFAVHDQPYEEAEDWNPNGGELPPYFGQSLEAVWADFREEKADAEVLPIARDPCANLISLGYAGEWAGAVWWYGRGDCRNDRSEATCPT